VVCGVYFEESNQWISGSGYELRAGEEGARRILLANSLIHRSSISQGSLSSLAHLLVGRDFKAGHLRVWEAKSSAANP